MSKILPLLSRFMCAYITGLPWWKRCNELRLRHHLFIFCDKNQINDSTVNMQYTYHYEN